jgi:hypothetical protein
MCCFLVALFAFGPRLAILVWWIYRPNYVLAAFNGWIVPILGLIFLPWTFLMYLAVYPGGIVLFDWVLLALGLFADIASYGSSAARRRDVPGYSGP